MVVLPAGSTWDTSVRILAAPSGSELSRQRFAFSLSDAGIDQGRQPPGFDGVAMIAAVLLLAGGLGAGLGLGGMNLPRCEPAASRVALVVGGGIAVVLGASIAAGRLLG